MRDKILVVDDDPAARRILTLLLQGSGEILEASNGADALRLIEAERPRIMILDMSMPGMSGLDVLKALRASGATLLILVLTGQEDVELAKRALELGAKEYITKPFELPRLKEKVLSGLTSAPKAAGGIPWRTETPQA